MSAIGFDDIVTNNRRMTVEKRGDPAGIIAWRFITHDDQVDTEGAEREFFNFQASQTYFWQATWRANRFTVVVKEGGVDGRTVTTLLVAAADPIPSGTGGGFGDGAQLVDELWCSRSDPGGRTGHSRHLPVARGHFLGTETR